MTQTGSLVLKSTGFRIGVLDGNKHLSSSGVCYRNWWSNMSYYHWSLKNCPIPHTQAHKPLYTLDTMKYTQYILPECSTAQTNDLVDNQDTYIQLGDTYIHFIQPDQHYTIISPDTQWYHTMHLPIPFQQWHAYSSIGTTRISCGCYSYQ